MQFTGEMHRAIIESLIETCKQSLVDGPKAGLAVNHESEHTNGGYLPMTQLMHCLQRVLTEVKPSSTENPEDGPLMCGLVSFEESQHFNDSISNINPDLAHYCCLCLRKLNEKAYELGVWDQQVCLPWCIIRKVMIIYYDKFTFTMMGDDSDPLYSTENGDMILEGIVERVPGGPSTNEEWLISTSCSSMRLKWMENLFKRFFIEHGDSSESSWPGHGNGGYRYDEDEDVYYIASDDICRWWAGEMRSYLPTHREFYGVDERPRPPDHPPLRQRPATVEPVNETKKKLTEILAFIEEKRDTWKMNEGDYLKISDLMKEAFDSV